MTNSRLVRLGFRLAGLPSLPPVSVGMETGHRFAAAANALFMGDSPNIPVPRLEFVRWLATNRAVVFHGQPHAED